MVISINMFKKEQKVFLKYCLLLYCQFHLSRDSSATKDPQNFFPSESIKIGIASIITHLPDFSSRAPLFM